MTLSQHTECSYPPSAWLAWLLWLLGLPRLGWLRPAGPARRRGTYFAKSGWLINEIPLLSADERLAVEKTLGIPLLANAKQALIVASPVLFLPVGVLNVTLIDLARR